MAHFTCVGATVPELRSTLDEMHAAGIDNVLALRGDPPAGEEDWVKTEGGLEYSRELVELIKADYPFAIGAACFPETHIHAVSPQEDIDYLAEKVAAGVDFLITQLFFDNALYFDFVARARAAGIGVPIIPGILPITQIGQLERMTRMCGASIPEGLRRELHAREGQPEAVIDFGVAYATLQCAELLAAGAPGIHFYTLNRSPATRAILGALKLARPWEKALQASSISSASATVASRLRPRSERRSNRSVCRFQRPTHRVASGAWRCGPCATRARTSACAPSPGSRPLPLGHPVEKHLVRLAHLGGQFHDRAGHVKGIIYPTDPLPSRRERDRG